MKGLRTYSRWSLAAVALLASIQAQALDWPQFLGPNHDLSSTDPVLTNWATQGLVQRWSATLAGNSSFVVSQGRAYTLTRTNLDSRHRQELCLALDSLTGRVLWSTVVGDCSDLSTDANSTPTISGNHVLVLSGDLRLGCLDARSGTVIWSVNLVDQFAAQPVGYGSAAAPLVDNDLVLINSNSSAVGDRLLAFRVADGQLVWRAAAGPAEHATPILAVIHGIRQAIFFTENGLVSVAPETGTELWRHEMASMPKPSPVVVGDIVFYCDVQGAGAIRVKRSSERFAVEELWTTVSLGKYLGSYYCTPVSHDSNVYGLFGDDLVCIDPATGTIRWSVAEPVSGAGGLVLIAGRLLILGEGGELTLADASPVAYRQVASFRPFNSTSGPCRTHPVVADGAIFVRSVEQSVCLTALDSEPAPVILSLPVRQPGGSFRVSASSSEGNLSEERAARFVWLTSATLGTPLESWSPLTNSLSANGRLELNSSSTNASRFFIGLERR